MAKSKSRKSGAAKRQSVKKEKVSKSKVKKEDKKTSVVKKETKNVTPPSSTKKVSKRDSKSIVKKDLIVGVRPSVAESRYATVSLSKLHPYVVNKNDERRKTMLEACGMRNSVTDSIISTMLSQNTTDANSKAAWKRLKEKFPDWEQLAECEDITEVEDAIRVAGLAKTRAERMQAMLRKVKEERGEASLDYIRDFNDEEVKKELKRFKGLGPKTISCVLLFALGRDEFPVDTHVLRITQKMGWISKSTGREDAYEYLNDMIPNDCKLDLHCLLVRHGKVCHCCAANGRPQFPPEDGTKLDCPLKNVNQWGGNVPLDVLKQFALDEDKDLGMSKLEDAIPVKVESSAIPTVVKSENH